MRCGAGASSYIVKSVDTADIASVVRQTASGNVFHPVLRGQGRAAPGDGPDVPSLTERERTILDAVATGLTTATISKNLWVSQHTVKFHLTNIYRKLGVTNRAGAVRYALENRHPRGLTRSPRPGRFNRHPGAATRAS